MNSRIKKHYDSILYSDLTKEYCGHSDFANFGFWDEDTADAKHASLNLVEKLLAFIPDKHGVILDVACGKGATTKQLLQHYAPKDVIAVNISDKQLKTARCNAPGCSFFASDAAYLQFADDTIDNIICVEAAFHFYTRKQFLKEARRVLKPGGHLVLSDVLMARGVEKRMSTFHEENFLANLEHYADVCRQSRFSEIQIIDVTKQCWQGHFWDMIRFIHAKYWNHEIGSNTLKSFLDVSYRFVTDLKYYLLLDLKK